MVLFVLPPHTSHVLQPLDVGIFGLFKSYYYNESASFMNAHMGQKITRFDMAKLACKAYRKGMTPLNIQSAFRQPEYIPCINAISAEKLINCEGFREASPVRKVAALKGGKDAVLAFLNLKKRKRHSAIKEMQHLPHRHEMPFVQQYKTTDAQTKVRRTRNHVRLV
ncbi:hypothetical protein DPMN_158049 [Dreissena polymorpha]|uniref:DDE-1 domain-containing protein n=1 Tax=Dreissena polymorpha TaxID=45954 RepID=A0A9D4EJ75_DREPO|nr:hypothetical protein DPMN_158049 [Dreissena polymorpha]